MKTFHFKSGRFELLLEECEEPIEIFEKVLSHFPVNTLETTDSVSDGERSNANDEQLLSQRSTEIESISIDSFMARKKPNSCRKMLEFTAEYLTKNMQQETFTKDELIKTATSSKFFKNDWRNHISVNLSRMIESGFLIHLISGDYRIRE